MAVESINLDDILGELCNLEEQLELQQEEFAKTSSHMKAHQSGVNCSSNLTSNPSSSLFFSTTSNGLASSGRAKSVSITKSSSRSQDLLCSRNGAERDGRKSVDFDLRPAVHESVDYDSDDVDFVCNRTAPVRVENGNVHPIMRDSQIKRVAVDSSCSSSRNSGQSFNSDSNDSSVAMPHGYTNGNASFGLSESLNSFGTMSSQGSQSSGSSGNSASPGKSGVQVCFRVYSPDGTSKTVGADRQMTAGQLCEVLARKNMIALKPSLTLVEQVHDLYMERIIEDHQCVGDVVDCWVKDSINRLMFADIPQKCAMFTNQQQLFENDSYTPDVEGALYLKAEGKKSWKKLYFVLRASGLYYSLKGKGKATSDLVCLQPLRDVDIYTAVNWKKKHRSPTDYGFALKTAMIQKNAPKYIKYLCAEDSTSLWQWITALRLAKHGKKLLENHRRATLNMSGTKLTRSATTVGSGRSNGNRESADCLNNGPVRSNGNHESADCLNSNPVRSNGNRESSDCLNTDPVRSNGYSMAASSDRLYDTATLDRSFKTMKSQSMKLPSTGGPGPYGPGSNGPGSNGPGSNGPGSQGAGSQGSQCTDARATNVYYEKLKVDDEEEMRAKRKEHGRSNSIDRLLDDMSDQKPRGTNHVRSSSSDRLLDGFTRRRVSVDSDDDDGYGCDTSTIRRASRQSDRLIDTSNSYETPNGGSREFLTSTLDSRSGSFRRRKSSLTGATPNKMVPHLPITTNVTRQMSMQQPYDVRTLPRQPKKSRHPLSEYDDELYSKSDFIGTRPSSNGYKASVQNYRLGVMDDSIDTSGGGQYSTLSERSSSCWSSDVSPLEGDTNSESSGGNYSDSRLYSRIDSFPQTSGVGNQVASSNTSSNANGNLSSTSANNNVSPPVCSNIAPMDLTAAKDKKQLTVLTVAPLTNGIGKYSSIEDLPVLPCPVTTETNTSHRRSPSPDIFPLPPPPIPCAVRTPVSRNRPASPDMLPPPPPEFLLAFPPSQSWHEQHHEESEKFEEKLDSELEFLEQQISQLSPVNWTTEASCADGLHEPPGGKGMNFNHQSSTVIVNSNSRVSGDIGPVISHCDKRDVSAAVYSVKPVVQQTHQQVVNSAQTQPVYATNVNSIEHVQRHDSINAGTYGTGLHMHHAGSNSARHSQPINHYQPMNHHRRDATDHGYASISEINVQPPGRRDSLKSMSGTGPVAASKPPPAPPRRSESTKLSMNHVDGNDCSLPQTRHFITDLDRVIAQKHDQGVDGVGSLEIPLPPPPPVILEDNSAVNFADLPPPPTADMLAGIRTMKRTGPKVMPKRK